MAGPERGFSGLTKRDLLDMVAEPKRVLQRARGASSTASFAKRLLWDAVPRPHFAYGMYHGADQARALGLDAISVLEFGVAGGNGLVAMEELAEQITAELGVRIEIYGFDTGAGMPAPRDYRDMAYVWQPGAFEMDVPALEGRLTTAKLVLGDVADTIPTFVDEYQPAPIAFCSFDLDYHSSTVAAFGLFEHEPSAFLPRVYCYLDDVVGNDIEIHTPFTGELAAVEDFNAAHDTRKIAKIHGLSWKRPVPAVWNEQVFAFQIFDHPQFDTHIQPSREAEFQLRSDQP
ncbi:MAG: hypothetical protein ACERLM_03375 [Acidimicrobiales bacterium]